MKVKQFVEEGSELFAAGIKSYSVTSTC